MEMKRVGLAVVVLIWGWTGNAQEKVVTGSVTYVAVGTVYTSLGRDSGIKDSTLVYVCSGKDTIAVLRVNATSSKSSSCSILKSSHAIPVGSTAVARVTVESPKTSPDAQMSSVAASPQRDAGLQTKNRVSSSIEFRGRISTQYFATRYENTMYNITQPGIVLDFHGRSTDVPLKFELYSNLRTLSYGNASPFSRHSSNQSRIYRLSLEYDDGVHDVAVGRVLPMLAPALGYIDGALYSLKLGRVTIGTTFGYQPGFALRGISTEYKKAALFTSIQPVPSTNLAFTAAYARTYYRSLLDREVASGNLTWYSEKGFQLYAYSEVDLRSMTGGSFKLAPRMSSLFVNASYRLTQMLSLGIGADASRPIYPFSTARVIPDSLLETSLRSGLSSSVSLYLPGGVTLSNTYAPRTSESRFASVYSNFTTLSFANVFSSGITLRSNFNLNANEYSSSNGYGGSVQKTILDIVDINVRYQQNTYTLKNYNDRHLSRTLGSDLVVLLTRGISFMMTYDRLNGYGITSNSFFGELSVRF